MQKKVSILLAALITLSMLAVCVPVRGSIGNILIETTTPPSGLYTRKLGQNVSLHFGGVMWSGGTVDLYLSPDGYASLNLTTDIFYGRRFSIAKLKGSWDNVTYAPYSVGNNWIIGPIGYDYVAGKMLDVPGGDYYVKAFDGATAAVAVTDNYIKINATFKVVPNFGPGQVEIKLEGYALPPNDYANFSYDTTKIKDLVQANSKGRVTYPMRAPDLKAPGIASPGNLTEAYDTINFKMVVNSTGQTETFGFKEYRRGLVQLKGKTSITNPNGYLFGNGSDFYTPGSGLSRVDVEVLGSLIIVGKWFCPASATKILWDKTTEIGVVTANSTHGWFNTTVTVPITSKGRHNVTLSDGKCIFWFEVNVIPTLKLVPDEGPVGTVVTAYGYGFVASTSTKTYNVTLWWDYVNACKLEAYNITKTKVGTNGQFTTTFTVPHTVGGAHTVNGTEDDTAKTGAEDTFTVKASLVMAPTSFYNNGTVVTMNATGLAYKQAYDLNLDNHKDFLVAGDCVGDFSMKFVAAAGFDAGVHVAVMYKTNGTGFNPAYEGHVLFTVNSVERDVLVDKLDEALENLDEIKESLGDLTDLVEGESAHLDSVKAALLAAIETARGDVSTLAQQLADIETLATTAAQQASSAAASSSTAATNASDAKTAAQGAQATTSGISIAVYGAVILSLIAALASIVAVITLQRKVAG